MVNELSCALCDVTFYKRNTNGGIEEAKAFGVTSVPAMAVDGVLLDYCRRRAITKEDSRLLVSP